MQKRFIEEKLLSYLKFMPVVLIRGARQTGKTTLTHMLGKENGYKFYNLDEALELHNAGENAVGWISQIEKPAIIDEVQKAPEIFLPIKVDVDQNRIPGRYLLTGSANPLLLPRMGDSLAGRMGIIDLFPFSQSEIRKKESSFINNIFANEMPAKSFSSLPKEELSDLLFRGGFPYVQTLSESQISGWMGSYLQMILDRDVRDLSQIEGLREFPLLFRLLASRTGNLLNLSDVSRSLGISAPTLKRYISLLEALFFIYLLPGWYTNLGKRVTKSPKIHLCDTGILSYLLNANEEKIENDPLLLGPMLETFVFTELQKMRSWSSIRFDLYHFRDLSHEVDFVLEQPDGTIVGIEVKSTHSINSADLRGLRHLKSISKGKFFRGIVLYCGNQVGCYDDNLFVLPIQSLWG